MTYGWELLPFALLEGVGGGPTGTATDVPASTLMLARIW